MSDQSRPRPGVTATVVLCMLITFLGSASPSASAQVRIGIIAPMTGAVPSFGVAVANGIDLAIAEWNGRGGILGNQMVAVLGDGQCTAEPALVAARKLIEQDHVQYIIGEVCSQASIAVSLVANDAEVIQITPTSTNTAVTVDPSGRTKAYVFRSCFIDSRQGIIGARFAYDRLGARTAFVLRDPLNGYDSLICDSFAEEFRRLGGVISADESYRAGTTDFTSLLASVRDVRPDVVCLPDFYAVANLVTRQARDTGLAVPFLGGDGWDSPDLDPSTVAGSYFVNHFAVDDPRPEVQLFLSAYQGAYPGQTANALAALAYDATQMLLQSMQAAGSVDPARVRDALEAIRFTGVTGELVFDVEHNPIKTGVIMAVREDGVRFETTIGP